MYRYATSDRYSQSPTRQYDRYSSLSRRSKSPYRSTSSLNNSRASSSSNLKIDTDNFDALNKSLRRHDASFLLDGSKDRIPENSAVNDSRYGSLKHRKPKSDRFDVDKLNPDYSRSKLYGSSGSAIGKYRPDSSSSDFDYNNNTYDTPYESGKSKSAYGKASIESACHRHSSSESEDYDISAPSTYPTPSSYSNNYSLSKSSPYTTTTSGARRPYGTTSTSSGYDKGDHVYVDSHNDTNDRVVGAADHGDDDSDDSMSEYLHCKSFCPDSVSDSKLFHGPRSSFSSPTPSSQSSHRFDLSTGAATSDTDIAGSDVQFVPIAKFDDQQAIRTADFHPSGRYFAIGSNSKLLRVFQYSSQDSNNNAADSICDIPPPELIYKRPKYHKGSIYCLTWNKLGNLLATGSNDKSIKLIGFQPDTRSFHSEIELNAHDGTIRDLCFMDDLTNGSSLLLSGGAGDCKINITDCETATPFLSLSGHSGPILSLYTWGGAMFVSGSQDRTIRFWDLRSNSCINFVTCPTISRTKPGGAVASVCVDPTGKLLVSGHEDSTCMLYDIRGGRVIQTFHPHTADIRTTRFSSKAYYLLSGGYDNRIMLTDLQGDLTQPLKSVMVAEHDDKVIQCRWHPVDFTFLSTSADKSAILWALPD